jgi:CRISPR-associated protein Cas2
MEVKLLEDYFSFDETEPEAKRKYLVVVIYDVVDNRRRAKLSKYLKSFGYRVQKSAFECILDLKTYKKLTKGIKKYINSEDLLRIYRMAGNTDVQVWGNVNNTYIEDIIIV